jgi:hypothetical protein
MVYHPSAGWLGRKNLEQGEKMLILVDESGDVGFKFQK